MPETLHAFEFLVAEPQGEIPPVCALAGDEPLLKHECMDRIRGLVLAGEDDQVSLIKFDGRETPARAVFDELATISMFGGRRLVMVEEADDFITEHRTRLEDYCDRPRGGSVLVLVAASLPGNTKLHKKIAQSGLFVDCSLPKARFGGVDEAAVLKWMKLRASGKYNAKLADGADDLLLEIVGPQLGRIDQELAKLALLAGSGGSGTEGAGAKRGGAKLAISRELVEQSVGGWRAKTAWAMIESALEGKAPEALLQLDRLLSAGEEPIALLAMMGGSLRRLASAVRIVDTAEAQRRRISLREALVEAGVNQKKFILDKTETQLRQVGRQRGRQIFHWLLEADLALKGASSGDRRARLVLEQLVVRFAGAGRPQ